VFFLDGVLAVATETTQTTQNIVHLVEADRAKVGAMGRAAGSTSQLYELAVRRVVVTPKVAAEATALSGPTVHAGLRRLEDAGILREITGRQRGVVYVYGTYLDMLNAGTAIPVAS
jgi:Fic family protein